MARVMIPEGVYRIRNASRAVYLAQLLDMPAMAFELNADDAGQKWHVKESDNQKDSLYAITNSDNVHMCILQSSGVATSDHHWNLDSRGLDELVIGAPNSELVVTLAEDNNELTMSARANNTAQRWILEPVPELGPLNTIKAGEKKQFNIKNRCTKSEICVWTDYALEYAPVVVYPAKGAARDFSARAWEVSQFGNGYLITNSYYIASGPRALREGPSVNVEPHACRVIPVLPCPPCGPEYYYIALSTDPHAWVLADKNPVGSIEKHAQGVKYDETDKSQHWEFNIAT